MSGTTLLASVHNERVKAVVRLRDRRERDRTGLTLVDGAREIGRALVAGVVLESVYVCPELLASGVPQETLAALRSARAPLVEVAPAVLERMAFGDRSDGLVAVVRRPSTALEDLALAAEPLLVVVDGVEKPGNVGAIMRTADGAGADGVIVTDLATDLYNPNAIRASLGTIFRLRPVVADADAAGERLRAAGIRVVTARVDADRLYHEVDLTGALALVVGSEAEGLGSAWAGPEVVPVRLPMLGIADSLNVSVAAAILLYEARRQRGLPTDR